MVFRLVPVDGELWRQTFDMSSGPEDAKRPSGRPRDGGVGFRAQNMKDWSVVTDDAASTWNGVKACGSKRRWAQAFAGDRFLAFHLHLPVGGWSVKTAN